MMRCVEIGSVKLFHGDMFDVLPDLDEKADLVVTDPPYRLSSGGTQSDMGGIFNPDIYDNSGELMSCVAWQDIGGPLYRACKPDADAYVMTNDKNLIEAANGLAGAGWRRHKVLMWIKNTPNRTRYYMNTTEFTLFMWKGCARDIRFGGSKQHSFLKRPGLDLHPTEKPIDLMGEYIRNSSNVGDLVLDPFAGSATTLAAAIKHERRAIGVELDGTYFERAEARLKALNGELVV